MDAPPTRHPTDPTLHAYALGKLDEIAAESVKKHLETCPECRRHVAELSSDSVIGPREKVPGSPVRDVSSDGSQTADAAPVRRGEASPTANTLPLGLADHPDYEIIRLLGGGSMGVVFLAHNRIMARDEVLKVINRTVIERRGVFDRFVREIRTVASLQHPNIVNAYTAFRAGGSLVFAMEYIQGLDLARMVIARGPLPVANACSYVHQAAMGLQHAHEAGLVHRDIKPSNLMLTRKGDRALIKLLDFGLAKASRDQEVIELGSTGADGSSTAASDLTMTGQTMGTPDFIAPEQITNAHRADIRADIYSLGCTLYYLLGGRPPFEASTTYEVLKAHRLTDAQPLNLVRPEVPAELAAVIARMMAKKPGRRFQTPAEVAEALTPFFKKPAVALSIPSLEGSPVEAIVIPALSMEPAQQALASERTQPDPIWSTIIEIDETEDYGSKDLSSAAKSGPKRSDWLRPAVAAGAVAFAVILIGIVVILAFKKDQLGFRADHPGDRVATDTGGTRAGSQLKGRENRRGDRSDPGSVRDRPGAAADAPASEPGKRRVADAKARPAAPRKVDEVKKPQTEAREPKTLVRDGREKKPVEAAPGHARSAFGQGVEQAIQKGVLYLKKQQRPDGSWQDAEEEAKTGTTSLVTWTLLSAGVRPDSTEVQKALKFLRGFRPDDLRSTYAIALQTMVYAAAEPDRDGERIAVNAMWLERAQIKPGDPVQWPGAWTYSDSKRKAGDNSNTQYALLGLHAASETGVRIDQAVWVRARDYWEQAQKRDGGWSYTPDSPTESASMTCAGIASLIITRYRRLRPEFQEHLANDTNKIQNCGVGRGDAKLRAGVDWLNKHFAVGQNFGVGQQWKYDYLYGLERAGHLSGIRFFDSQDWFRLGAEELVQNQDKADGSWRGVLVEGNPLLATSFAVSFLAKGRTPVLIHKLIYPPAPDWNYDPDDVRNLVEVVARDWHSPLTWRFVDAKTASVSDLSRAPILFFNGHKAPELSEAVRQKLQEYVERGGVILADACCGSPTFDQGFKKLMKEVFPGGQEELRPLADDHPIWKGRKGKPPPEPKVHPLWGIDRGGRTVVIYSPTDLSCYWNQAHHNPANPAVIQAVELGQNVVDYVTGRKPPPDKSWAE